MSKPPLPPGSTPPEAASPSLDEARALYAELDPAWFDDIPDANAWLLEPGVQKIIDQVLDEVIAPWRGRLRPDDLALLRDELWIACHTDPRLIEYLDRLRPRPERDRSGKANKNELSALVNAVRSTRKGGGER